MFKQAQLLCKELCQLLLPVGAVDFVVQVQDLSGFLVDHKVIPLLLVVVQHSLCPFQTLALSDAWLYRAVVVLFLLWVLRSV